MDSKIGLRNKYLKLRRNMTQEHKNVLDENIKENFLSSEEYLSCDNILIYVSTDIEVGTVQIIRSALKQKNVYCPKCKETSGDMDFYKINSFDDLDIGKFRILEPVNCNDKWEGEPKSICVVPGLVYDSQGFRIGFGKGYYDKFLKNFSGRTIGLCYKDFLIDKVPADEHDVKVQKIITEN